jgi:hypothetical protein
LYWSNAIRPVRYSEGSSEQTMLGSSASIRTVCCVLSSIVHEVMSLTSSPLRQTTGVGAESPVLIS